MTDKHICGKCLDEFLTEQEYLDHKCPITNFTPADPEHHGPEFLAVQAAALERGREQLDIPADIAKQDEAIAQVQEQIAAIEAIDPEEDDELID